MSTIYNEKYKYDTYETKLLKIFELNIIEVYHCFIIKGQKVLESEFGIYK